MAYMLSTKPIASVALWMIPAYPAAFTLPKSATSLWCDRSTTSGLIARGCNLRRRFMRQLYPQKRTWIGRITMSALCQKRTHAPQQSAAENACSCGLNLPLNDDRQRECKSRALAGLGIDPNPGAVHFNDALRYGETQAGAESYHGQVIALRAKRWRVMFQLGYLFVIALAAVPLARTVLQAP